MTSWALLVGLKALTLTVDTDDPSIVAMIEAAAERQGLQIRRLPAEPKPEPEVEA